MVMSGERAARQDDSGNQEAATEAVRIKWWKLKKEKCCAEFRKELKRALGGKDDRESTAEVLRELPRSCLMYPRDGGTRTRRRGGGMRKEKKAFKGKG